MKQKHPLRPNFLRFFLTFLAITAAPTLFVLGAIPELLAAELRTTQGSPSELVNALAGEDAVARYRAEEHLVKMGDKAVVALKPLATSPGFAPARQYAIIVLGRIANEKAIALLLEVLEKEPDVKLRALVCTHLGRLGVEEAVSIIGTWLFSIQGKSFPGWYPGVSKPTLFWFEHVYALWAIGSEKGIPILEEMLKTKHGGSGGRDLRRAYREVLYELKQQALFWDKVRRVRDFDTPSATQSKDLEPHVRLLFDFFRKDTLAWMRLYRDKIIRGGLEGRWVLEDIKNHPDEKLRKAAAVVLSNYGKLGVRLEDTK